MLHRNKTVHDSTQKETLFLRKWELRGTIKLHTAQVPDLCARSGSDSTDSRATSLKDGFAHSIEFSDSNSFEH